MIYRIFPSFPRCPWVVPVTVVSVLGNYEEEEVRRMVGGEGSGDKGLEYRVCKDLGGHIGPDCGTGTEIVSHQVGDMSAQMEGGRDRRG